MSIKIDAQKKAQIIRHGAILIDWGCKQTLHKMHQKFSFAMPYVF